MNCREWEERVALYAGGDLEEATRLEVERHLNGCPECSQLAGGLAESLAVLRAAHAEDIAPAHYAAVRARVIERLRPVHHWWRWMAAAGAVLALLLVWISAPLKTQPEWGGPPGPRRTPPSGQGVRPTSRASASVGSPQAPAPAPAPPAPRARRVFHQKPPRPVEPLLVKIETDNPDVVIYWIAN